MSIKARTLQVISEHAGDTRVDLIKDDWQLSAALGMDPGDTAEAVMALEAEFGIAITPTDFPHSRATVGDLLALVERKTRQVKAGA